MSAGVKNLKQSTAQPPQWNIQVVRGKVTTRCLWNACKALSIGLLLLTIGTTMAIVGYYADQLSIRSETIGNSTVKFKNESRGFHLNNLSYAGPIIMGIGGFIVVAACVMTFEARDSAAKVVPARFKPNLDSSGQGGSTKSTPRTARGVQRTESRKNTVAQTPGEAGRCSRAPTDWSPKNNTIGRKAFTAAFVQLSRELMENSYLEESRRWREAALSKSPSAPDLAVKESRSGSPDPGPVGHASRKLKVPGRTGGRSQRESARPLAEEVSSNLLLRPNNLRRQAASMDCPFYENYECCTLPSTRLFRQPSRRSGGSRESLEVELGYSAGGGGSQASMALDLHDCQVTLKVTDASANKRSDTSRKHQLLRQKPVEDDREEKYMRCLGTIPRFLGTPTVEEFNCRTKSSSNLKSPCQHCIKETGRGHIPKMSADFRSQSFSITSASTELKTGSVFEDHARIFCIEDHKKKANPCSENIRVCYECLKRHSPCVSPHANPRNKVCGCRAEGVECLVHKAGHALVRNNAKRRKSSHKLEGSLSTEEQDRGKRAEVATRSASFSPTGYRAPSTTSPANNSRRESPSSRRSPSTVIICETQTDTNTEAQQSINSESNEDNLKKKETKTKKPS